MTSAFKDKEGQRITYKTVKTESGLSIKCFHGSMKAWEKIKPIDELNFHKTLRESVKKSMLDKFISKHSTPIQDE